MIRKLLGNGERKVCKLVLHSYSLLSLLDINIFIFETKEKLSEIERNLYLASFVWPHCLQFLL